mgnify:CR=1 FL=1
MTNWPAARFCWRLTFIGIASLRTAAPFHCSTASSRANQIKPVLQRHQRKHDPRLGGARPRLVQKYGLDMQFILMPRNPLAIAALLAGEIDAAIVGPGHLVNAGLSGADVIGIANFNQKLDFRLNTRPEIKKPEDLHGKRIAISGPGSTSHLVTDAFAPGTQRRSDLSEDCISDDTGDGNEPAPGA